jgi:hypothetical protein
VELMLADPADPARHVTRAIAGVESVHVDVGPTGRDATLRIDYGDGRTVVTFEEPDE